MQDQPHFVGWPSGVGLSSGRHLCPKVADRSPSLQYLKIYCLADNIYFFLDFSHLEAYLRTRNSSKRGFDKCEMMESMLA